MTRRLWPWMREWWDELRLGVCKARHTHRPERIRWLRWASDVYAVMRCPRCGQVEQVKSQDPCVEHNEIIDGN